MDSNGECVFAITVSNILFLINRGQKVFQLWATDISNICFPQTNR